MNHSNEQANEQTNDQVKPNLEVLILNLDYLPARYQRTVDAITDTVIENHSRFSASNGFELEHADELQKHIDEQGYTNSQERYRLYQKIMVPLQEKGWLIQDYKSVIKPGTLGNYHSWYRILTHIVANSNQLTLVLEDDIIIPNKCAFNRSFRYLMNNLPSDFDIIYLGTSICSTINCQKPNEGDILMKILPSKQIAGLYCVLVTYDCAVKMLNRWFPMREYSDIEFNKAIDDGTIIGYHVVDDMISVDYTESYTNSAAKEGFTDPKITEKFTRTINLI